ncbi:MAG TPA: hypothetical protein VLV83_18935 [Acidobacteriota bacterium]|nr:hypothetical protein [Acidobacteriota bacterium]
MGGNQLPNTTPPQEVNVQLRYSTALELLQALAVAVGAEVTIKKRSKKGGKASPKSDANVHPKSDTGKSSSKNG